MAAARGTRARVRLQQVLVGVFCAALCLVMVFLGLWQMQVFESQKANTASARAAQPAVTLDDHLDKGSTMPLYGRRVSVTGHFLPNQVLAGTEQPLRVVTAFKSDGGHLVAVVRGTTSGAAPAPSSAPTTITGVILPSQSDPRAPVPAGSPAGTMNAVRLDQLVQQWPTPLLDGYVTLGTQEQAAQGLGTVEADIPQTDGGRTRNQGYALQWWAFAGFGAVVAWVWIRAIGRRLDDED